MFFRFRLIYVLFFCFFIIPPSRYFSAHHCAIEMAATSENNLSRATCQPENALKICQNACNYEEILL